MADLSDIIERLEMAERPSRPEDCHLWVIAQGGDARMNYVDGDARNFVWERGIDGMWVRGVVKFGSVPKYTASIDAAVSLAGRVLPGWFWRCGSTPLFPNGWAHVSRYHADHCDRRDEASCADGKAANVAIALVLATLRALQQKGSSNG